MAFCDLLRTTVLLAGGSATALAAITVLAANRNDDTLTLLVAAGWWTIALVGGLILGRPSRAAAAISPVLAGARTTATLPDTERPGVAALARLWPIGVFAVVAGGLGFALPGVAAIGTGFALAAALAWRAREAAVAAIEDRDGVRFYVEPGSALQPVKLVRSPGLRRDRPPPGHPPPPAPGV
ncbi:MAG: hypothetical protein ACRDK5_11270 [Solirubrobacterales bacterium]